jgi:hypothetical protein
MYSAAVHTCRRQGLSLERARGQLWLQVRSQWATAVARAPTTSHRCSGCAAASLKYVLAYPHWNILAWARASDGVLPGRAVQAELFPMFDEASIRSILTRARAAIAQSHSLTLQIRSSRFDHDVVGSSQGAVEGRAAPCSGTSGAPRSEPNGAGQSLQNQYVDLLDTTAPVRAGGASAQESSISPRRATIEVSGTHGPSPLDNASQISVWVDRTRGVALRLADLTQQHTSTLKELFALRLRQLVLRKQQVSALKGLIVVQMDVLGDAPVVTTAVCCSCCAASSLIPVIASCHRAHLDSYASGTPELTIS